MFIISDYSYNLLHRAPPVTVWYSTRLVWLPTCDYLVFYKASMASYLWLFGILQAKLHVCDYSTSMASHLWQFDILQAGFSACDYSVFYKRGLPPVTSKSMASRLWLFCILQAWLPACDYSVFNKHGFPPVTILYLTSMASCLWLFYNHSFPPVTSHTNAVFLDASDARYKNRDYFCVLQARQYSKFLKLYGVRRHRATWGRFR